MMFGKKNSGFSVVELLVAVALFATVVAVVGNIFLVSLLGQRRFLAQEEIFEQASFLSEYMSRSLRMARKEMSAPACLSANGLNYEKTRSGNGIKFLNSQNVCQEFFLDTGSRRLKENKAGTEQFLTAADVEGLAFSLNLLGENQTDSLQPRVTFFLRLRSKASKPELQPVLDIQTTVSQRNLDVQQ
jgi:prepilin-type N-terminal cleavage/methylation domain-containing protein